MKIKAFDNLYSNSHFIFELNAVLLDKDPIKQQAFMPLPAEMVSQIDFEQNLADQYLKNTSCDYIL